MLGLLSPTGKALLSSPRCGDVSTEGFGSSSSPDPRALPEHCSALGDAEAMA